MVAHAVDSYFGATRLRVGLHRLALFARRFRDFAGSQAFGADLDAPDSAVDFRPDFLDIGLELALGPAGRAYTDAAEVFSQATVGNLITACGVFSAKLTLPRHNSCS